MTMTCSGMSLTDIANRLMARLEERSARRRSLMDLAVISHLWFKHDIGLATQAQALKIKRLYQLPASGGAKIRLLALMHHGDLAANTPLEFIVQGSDIALDMLYLDPAQGLPADLPEHDLLFVAVGESARSRRCCNCWRTIVKLQATVVEPPRTYRPPVARQRRRDAASLARYRHAAVGAEFARGVGELGEGRWR